MGFNARSLLLAPLLAAGLAMPAQSGPIVEPTQPTADCMAPRTFLTALTSAGDWIVKRSPNGVGDESLTGVVFREAGLINIALFKDGCLAMVVIVGKAQPDIQV